MVFIIDDIIIALIALVEILRLIFIGTLSLFVFTTLRTLLGKWDLRNEVAGILGLITFAVLWFWILNIFAFLGLAGVTLAILLIVGIPTSLIGAAVVAILGRN